MFINSTTGRRINLSAVRYFDVFPSTKPDVAVCLFRFADGDELSAEVSTATLASLEPAPPPTSHEDARQ